MRRPPASKRFRISPIAFLATASGLMIDSVRSTAMLAPGCHVQWLNRLTHPSGAPRQAAYCTVDPRRRTEPLAARTSDRERFTAAAGTVDMRIVEVEHLVEPGAAEIHGRALQYRQVPVVDHHLRAVAAEDIVGGGDLVGEVHGIGIATAAGLAHAQAQADAVTALVELTLDSGRRGSGQRQAGLFGCGRIVGNGVSHCIRLLRDW